MPAEVFYVYENWTNTFAKVHRGSCPYCNDGQGFQGKGTHTPSGRWLGPYDTDSAALAAAQHAAASHKNAAVWEVGSCGYCS